jgi:hypothetical protein
MITPASIRTNNPGAMYPGPSAKKFGSRSFETLRSKDGVHKIARFPSATHGAAALFDLLSSKRYCGTTIEAAITNWCGGFYSNTYLNVLEANADLSRSDILTLDLLKDPTRAIALAKAMARQEAGRDYPMTDLEWLAAHQMAFYGATGPAWSPENDIPSPRPETRQQETVKRWAPTVGLGLAGGAATAPAVAPVPQVLTDTLLNLSSWQAFGTSAQGLMTKQMLPPLVVAALVYWLVVKLIPWWRS